MYRNKKNVSKIRPFTRNSNRVLATWCALAVLALLLPLCLAAGTRRAGAPAGPAPAGSGWWRLAPTGADWFRLAPTGSDWLRLAPTGSFWILPAPAGCS